jgi:hypothetical protein
MKGFQAAGEASSLQKIGNIQHFKKHFSNQFFPFFRFLAFLDPDPQTQLNSDPIRIQIGKTDQFCNFWTFCTSTLHCQTGRIRILKGLDRIRPQKIFKFFKLKKGYQNLNLPKGFGKKNFFC